jgi:hypothetical protein
MRKTVLALAASAGCPEDTVGYLRGGKGEPFTSACVQGRVREGEKPSLIKINLIMARYLNVFIA